MYYSIDRTENTPFFKYCEGKFELVGRSHPLFPVQFYQKVNKLVDYYLNKPLDHTDVMIKLEFVNSSSNRSLMKMFQRFLKLRKKGYEVDVEWYYENNDEAIYDLGLMFKALTGLPFKFISS